MATGDAASTSTSTEDDRLFADAIAVAESWGATAVTVTGMWLDRRHLAIGVGIADGDEVETTEALRALAPRRISIRTRVADRALVELWQLQIEVFDYLEDALLWGRPAAVALGVDAQQDAVEIGLLAVAPPNTVDKIRARFPGSPITFAIVGQPIAV